MGNYCGKSNKEKKYKSPPDPEPLEAPSESVPNSRRISFEGGTFEMMRTEQLPPAKSHPDHNENHSPSRSLVAGGPQQEVDDTYPSRQNHIFNPKNNFQSNEYDSFNTNTNGKFMTNASRLS